MIEMLFPEKYWENPAVLHKGTEKPSAYLIPYGSREEALKGIRESSTFFHSLNGKWQFRFYPSITQLEEAFWEIQYNDSQWDSIPVPGMWQTNGYDTAQYLTSSYPFLYDPPHVPRVNPAGLYRQTMTIHKVEGKRYHLVFEGVDSCFYLWLNGTFIGYSQVPHAESVFDVTDLLCEGKNLVAVCVLKWCDGSYLDDQDKIRMSGIFRDVYLLERDSCGLSDLFCHITLSDTWDNAEIGCEFQRRGCDGILSAFLYDPDGELLQSISSDEQMGVLTFTIQHPKLWSAEIPTLYTLVLKVKDEIISKRIGIRKIEVQDGCVRINGAKVKFKGVNHHDTHPETGYVLPPENIWNDLVLMKRHNINTIRTSHYPCDPRFYEMCDQLGFYVVDEADLECHGCLYAGDFDALAKDPLYRDAVLDREVRMFERDKNNTCVVIWSLGNESGWGENLESAAKWLRQRDSSRLIHMESAFTQHSFEEQPYLEATAKYLDLYGKMYPRYEWFQEFLNCTYEKRPLFVCEYSHSMGNSCGDLKRYWDIFDSNDRFCGGCIWEWADHAIRLHTEDAVPYDGYGGDFGEAVHQGNLCADGLTTPDRVPHSALLEAKQIYAPVKIQHTGIDGVIRLTNRCHTDDLCNMILNWEIWWEGSTIQNGEIRDIRISPGAAAEFVLPYQTDGLCGEAYLNIEIALANQTLWAPAGYVLYQWQYKLMVPEKKVAAKNAVHSFSTRETPSFFDIMGSQWRYRISRETGMIEQIWMKNVPLFQEPLRFAIWRAPIDNDRFVRQIWEKPNGENYQHLLTQALDVQLQKNDSHQVEIMVPFQIGVTGRRPLIAGRLLYIVKKEGILGISLHGIVREHLPTWLPRFGLQWRLTEDLNEITFYGMGPGESYVDKHLSARMGLYHTTPEKMQPYYLRPQESGSIWQTHFCELRQKNALGLQIAGGPFSLNVSHYTPEELTRAKHPYELQRSGSLIVHTDYFMSGIGSASVGPELEEQYRLSSGEICFQLGVTPLDQGGSTGFDRMREIQEVLNGIS